jgi:hypothetical protein
MSMVSIIRFVIFQITASTISISMNQVLALVCDNASNNDTMVEELQVLVPSFRGQTTHVQCFAHILNLVVKV